MSRSIPITAPGRSGEVSAEQAHPSAMRDRFGWFAEFVARHLFSRVVMNERAVTRIRELSSQGTVIYALRHRSFIDYFLVNYVLRREGLPLPVFANGVTSTLLAPLRDLLQQAWRSVLARLRPDTRTASLEGHDFCAQAVSEGRPVLIFMRGRRSRSKLGRWFRRSQSSRVGTDYLRELVHAQRTSDREKFIVPLALFRGHSFRRRETGISALVYSVQEVPSEWRKLLAYWWNRRDLFITVGNNVTLSEFMQRYHADTEERLVRRLTRAIQIFLHREERVVLGPALLRRRQIKALVLENAQMAAGIRRIAEERQVSPGKLRKEAEGYLDEMAADFNGILFGIVAFFFMKIWDRMFSGLEPIGFEKVVEKVRHHPVVLVPCHRSHFDYLILTYLFHKNFVSPPHIAAGVNLSFWPLGPLFRASGAFFIRRSFADNELYKLVFRQYLSFLIREGYTQEFFIEGGRSRTGKIMTPRLGMLSAIVDAFLGGVRRDLYLAPVSIHYGRIVEEDAYQSELSGEEKEKESIGALLRARRFLKQKYGTVYLSFAEPISLNEALGNRKQRFVEASDVPEIEEEKRRFIQKLGFRILRDVNDCTVAGATSVSATVLLSAPRGGKRYTDFAAQANALVELITAEGITPTASLSRNVGDFRESLGFLSGNGLIDVIRRGDEEVLVVRENKRLALDFYKNNLIHVFVIPSLLSYCLLERRVWPRAEASASADQGVVDDALLDEIWWWLDLFRYEFALPSRGELRALVDATAGYFRGQGALTDGGIDTAHPLVRATIGVLDNFREAYWLMARTTRDLVGEDGISQKSLVEEFRKSHRAALLLGEVFKTEGAISALAENALNRFVELKFISREATGRGGKERRVLRGPAFNRLEGFVECVGRSVMDVRLSDPAR
jgi:glycerol-3-phosphate O-acyltransferase